MSVSRRGHDTDRPITSEMVWTWLRKIRLIVEWADLRRRSLWKRENDLIRIVTSTATQMRAKELGAALCGGYPGQNISVEGHASVVVRDSRAGLYGGAMLAHRVSMAGGAFRVELGCQGTRVEAAAVA